MRNYKKPSVYFLMLAVVFQYTASGDVFDNVAATNSQDAAKHSLRKLPPLQDVISQITYSNLSAEDKLSSIVYCATRFGSLCLSLSALFAANGTSEKSTQTSKEYYALGRNYLNIASVLADSTGMTEKMLSERVNMISTIYTQEMKTAKLTTNTYLSPAIQEEMQLIHTAPPASLLAAAKTQLQELTNKIKNENHK